MEPKIFNIRMFALIAAIVISTVTFARANAVSPQTNNTETDQFDEKALDKQMADLKVQMRDLQKQMNRLQIKKSQEKSSLAMTRAAKRVEERVKDMAVDLTNITTDINTNVGGSVNISSSNDEDYKRQVASGEISEKVKTYSKTYSVDGNDLLQIDNRFGKITVNTWNRNEFKVDVQMKLGSDNEEAANNLYNGSSISDSKVGSTVSFKTNIANSNMSGRNNNQHIEINYTVYMPAGNPIDITNKFGSVDLPDLSGKALIRVSYGSLTAASLTSGQNDVTVKFGDANIGTFNSGKVEVAYGKLKTGSVNNIDADIKFSSISIERLKGSADVSVKYGDGFRIGTIERTVRNISVEASFTKINFDFKQLDSFNFDVTTKFGNFNYDDRVRVTAKTPSDEERGWSSTKTYKGYAGKDNSSNKVVINASYTNVSFN